MNSRKKSRRFSRGGCGDSRVENGKFLPGSSAVFRNESNLLEGEPLAKFHGECKKRQGTTKEAAEKLLSKPLF